MRIESAELYFLRIPFRLAITHGARSGRRHSDSIVLRLVSGGRTGYGEAVFREYVSGPSVDSLRRQAARIAMTLVRPLLCREVTWAVAVAEAGGAASDPSALPMLCALETAILDLVCRTEGRDLFALLGREPRRNTVTYSGTIPLLPIPLMERIVETFTRLGVPDLKVKVGPEPATNDEILAACRRAAGDVRLLRVDANGCWTVADLDAHLAVCARHGVSVIEQPLAPSVPEANEALRRARGRGFIFMADEGFRSGEDLRLLAATGAYGMVNLRLAKNGGLGRLLDLAQQAEELGLRYQLGCMVGETGILSALGRVAAALLPDPRWVEGGYDELLLTGNVTTTGFGFGRGGRAPVIRDAGIGYTVDEERLARLWVARVRLD